MKKLFLAVLVITSCATNQYAFSELNSCPAVMDSQQYQSGVVRCRAECSSYARDFYLYSEKDCKCYCQPAMGGGYRKSGPGKSNYNEM